MLKDMKEGTEDNNEARKEAGYEAVHLIGWAEQPRYDASTKKLYWAKELNFEGSTSHTLNYDVRVLGREGVLSMNAVATMDQLGQIRRTCGRCSTSPSSTRAIATPSSTPRPTAWRNTASAR